MSLDKLPNRTYPALGFTLTDRGVKEFFAKRCPRTDLEDLHRYFRKHGGLGCIYCGSPNASRWDHVHPISQGGDTVKGNLVPACSSCDDSKQHKTLDAWFSGKAKMRPPEERRAAIKQAIAKYQRHFQYRPRPFLAKLKANQKAIYGGFQRKLAELKLHLRENGVTTSKPT